MQSTELFGPISKRLPKWESMALLSAMEMPFLPWVVAADLPLIFLAFSQLFMWRIVVHRAHCNRQSSRPEGGAAYWPSPETLACVSVIIHVSLYLIMQVDIGYA